MKYNHSLITAFTILTYGVFSSSTFAQNTIEHNDPDRLILERKLIDARTGERISSHEFNSAREQNIHQAKTNISWQSVGPNNLGGRFRALFTSSTSEVWAGGVAGGLFRSSNGGNTWSKVGSYTGSAYISAITEDASGNIYVSTGSKYETWDGNGIYYSTDNGATWLNIQGTDMFPKIDKVVSSPVTEGVFFSTDYGLKKWNPTDGLIEDVGVGANGPVNSLAMSVDGEIIVAAITSDTYVSKDGGTSWGNVSGTGLNQLPNSGFGRIEYAISAEKTDGKHNIYASLSEMNLVGGWLSKDDGDTWEQHTGTPSNLSTLNIFNYSGLEHSSLLVNPYDDKVLLVGGNNLFLWEEQSSSPLNGGWNQASSSLFPTTNSMYMHSGINVIDWKENHATYFATNGGVFISEDGATSFLAANRNLTSTQFHSVAYDKYGNVMGGTRNNGTVYNDKLNQNFYDYKVRNFGANFETEISFFNPDILLASGPYNIFYISTDGGTNFGSFDPILPTGYTGTGDNVQHPYHTEFVLAEYYDENSEDSVLFFPFENYQAGDIVKVPSKATGDTILYTTPIDLNYSPSVTYNPNLTTTDYIISQNGLSLEYDLGELHYTNITGNSYPPNIGDSLIIENDTVVVGTVTPYTHYYGTSPKGKVLDMGKDSVVDNVVWDTVRVQDPFQSWFLFTTLQNGGEVWGSRDVLRVSEGNPKWVRLAENLGTGEYDMEFSADLNHLFIASGGEVLRISGMSNVYSSDSAFHSKLSIDSANLQISHTIISGANYVSGIGVDRENPDVIVGVRGQFNGGVVRCENATSVTPVFNELSTPSMALYDVVIDRNNDQLLVAAGAMGAMLSQDGGNSWTSCSQGFVGTPAFEVRQNWRPNGYFGNTKEGELYLATFGRGVFVSSSILGLKENQASEIVDDKGTTINCYPNPVGDLTQFEITATCNEVMEVMVYSQTGQLVLSSSVHLAKGKQVIDLTTSSLERGVYFVTLQSQTAQYTSKFVK